MRDDFSTLDIVKVLGIPRERLRDWMNRKFVTPSTAAEGQGIRAIFSRSDVYAVALFKSLLEYGLNRKAAGKLVSDISNMTDFKDSMYIVLRQSGSGKKGGIHSIAAISEKAGRIDFHMGTISNIYSSEPMTDFGNVSTADIDWRTIHIMNYAALRKEVDAAIGKM